MRPDDEGIAAVAVDIARPDRRPKQFSELGREDWILKLNDRIVSHGASGLCYDRRLVTMDFNKMRHSRQFNLYTSFKYRSGEGSLYGREEQVLRIRFPELAGG